MVKTADKKTAKSKQEQLSGIKAVVQNKIKNITEKVKAFCKEKKDLLQKTEWKNLPSKIWRTIKKAKFKKTAIYKFLKKLSDSWKIVLTVIPLFLIFYYLL